ncbi:MAG: T9SS type A sorting domain-containing protein, partial [Ignavibacteria bacterium]
GYIGTSPSKPLWLRASEHWLSSTTFHPKLEWLLNTEPDVVTGGKYEIYRGEVTNPNVDPPYYYIATVNHPTNTYIDYEFILHVRGGGQGVCQYQYRTYAYRIKAVENENPPPIGGQKKSVFSDRSTISGYQNPCDPDLGPEPETEKEEPLKFSVSNYPNPFNPLTNIKFSIPLESFVTIKVYDIIGKEIITLVEGPLKAGSYSVKFDGTDLPSGIYIYRIEAGNFKDTKKMVLVK